MRNETRQQVDELRDALRALLELGSPRAAEAVESFVDRLCADPDPSLLPKALYQLEAARRRLDEVEDTAELSDFLARLYRRVDETQTLARQAAYDRDQQAAERTLAERIVDLFRRSSSSVGMRPTAIAEALEVDKFQVSRALARLQADGVVEVTSPPPGADGRTRWYALAPLSSLTREVLSDLADALEGLHPGFTRQVREVISDPAAERVYTDVLARLVSRPGLPVSVGQEQLAADLWEDDDELVSWEDVVPSAAREM